MSTKVLKGIIIKQRIFISIFILLKFSGVAQDTMKIKEIAKHVIAGLTESSDVEEKGIFQIQTDVQKEFKKIECQRKQNTAYNTILLKYSVNDIIELRLITSFSNDKIIVLNADNSIGSTIKYSGFGPITIGSKIAFQEEDGPLPEIGILGQLKLPYFGANNYKPEYIIPQFKLLFAHTLNKRFTLSYNLGADLDDQLFEVRGIYSASLGIHLSDNFSTFIESYGFLGKYCGQDHRMDGGFIYMIKNNIQLNCSGGIGLNKKSPSYFISGGLSVKFNANNKKKE
jgi:hypothetical protein